MACLKRYAWRTAGRSAWHSIWTGCRAGRIISDLEADAVVPLNDRGFLLGDGLFETIRVAYGRPFRLAQHLDRLSRGADYFRSGSGRGRAFERSRFSAGGWLV